jgi:hypothetical protein
MLADNGMLTIAVGGRNNAGDLSGGLHGGISGGGQVDTVGVNGDGSRYAGGAAPTSRHRQPITCATSTAATARLSSAIFPPVPTVPEPASLALHQY